MQQDDRTVTRPLATGYGAMRDRVQAADAGAVVRQLTEVLEGVVEDGRERAVQVFAPRAPRARWKWAVGAAVAGAAAGSAVALVVKRILGEDAPDAQEPEQLRAVVDTGPGLPPLPPV